MSERNPVRIPSKPNVPPSKPREPAPARHDQPGKAMPRVPSTPPPAKK